MWNGDNGDGIIVEVLMVRRLFVVFCVIFFSFGFYVDKMLNDLSSCDGIIMVSVF